MENTGAAVGMDLVEIDRIRALLKRFGSKALTRLLAPEELAYVEAKKDPAPHVAGFVAAKEACFKVMGHGPAQGIGWRDIVVQHNELGAPCIEMRGPAQTLLSSLNSRGIAVSISHERTLAGAIAILVR